MKISENLKKIRNSIILFFIISIIIHLALIISVGVASSKLIKTGNSNKSAGKNKGSGGNKDKGNNAFNVDIIVPKSPGKGIKKKSKVGYWGIGVTMYRVMEPVLYDGVFYYGEKIEEIYEGYPAYENGLMLGDIVILVNDLPISEERIRGDGPALLKITIWRNGKVFSVYINRQEISIEDT